MSKHLLKVAASPLAFTLFLFAVFLVIAAPAAAQGVARPTGAIAGRVAVPGGQPAPGVEVTLVDLGRRTTTGADGSFRFEGLPPGDYILEVASPRLGTGADRVTVTAGGVAEVTLELDLAVHREEIVVTASADPRSQIEIAQPTSVLSGDELTRRLEPSLGETLDTEPGVSSTYFGPGASRPVIRGLGGDRVRILSSGIGVGDASSTSPDHAVSVDPLAAERIEVLRGPATLLYGSSAVGGVINVLEGAILDHVPDARVTGTVELRGGTVADERSGAVSVSGGAGRFAWHADVLTRETDDYEIPGFAESRALRAEEAAEGEEHEQVRGLLENSALETDSGTVGLSWVGDGGFLGISGSIFDTLYGIPGGHTHEHEGEEGEEGAVRIDMEQRRSNLRGGVTRPFGPFRGANVRFGTNDYEHVELEGEEVGTRFLNDAWEGRVELIQRPYGALSGSFGLQVTSRDFEAIGEEAFVPPTRTDAWAVFLFEELTRGDLTWQAGARYERQDVTAETDGVNDRSVDGLSGSLGLVWSPGVDYSLGLALARSTKLPNAEELFSNGPHIATNAFEVGDPALEQETSLGIDLTLRKRTGPVTGELTLFANRFDDFIFERATGEEEAGLPVFLYVQRDAEFVGAELTGVVELYHDEPGHLDLEVGADIVRAELRETGEPLPRIPPVSWRLGLHYHGERWNALVEGQRAEEQDRVSELERPTDAYTLVNASVGYRFFTDRLIYDVMLRGTNLTDEEARNHVSYLKELVPLPGRDVGLVVRLTF